MFQQAASILTQVYARLGSHQAFTLASKEWMVTFTRDVKLSIAADYGPDKYGRLVIDLSAAGVDIGLAG